ncbi:MAG: Tn3 family transposase [Bacteroides stercoris]
MAVAYFILRYATDNVLRKKIPVRLNKGETMNGLARTVFFEKRRRVT